LEGEEETLEDWVVILEVVETLLDLEVDLLLMEALVAVEGDLLQVIYFEISFRNMHKNQNYSAILFFLFEY